MKIGLTNGTLVAGPRCGWLAAISSPPFSPPPGAPPFPVFPPRLSALRRGVDGGVRHHLEGAVLLIVALLLFVLGGREDCAAREPRAVHRGQAGVTAEAAPPPVIARVAVAGGAVAGGAVAGGAVAGALAQLALMLAGRVACAATAAAAAPPPASEANVPLLSSSAPLSTFSSSSSSSPPPLALQEVVELREALDGEAAG